SKQNGYDAMMEIMKSKEQPSAVFCASDMMAIGAIQAIHDSNKKVPEDYSVMGFDGIDISQIVTPRLTTIKQDTVLMGKIAAKEILKMMDKNKRLNAGKTIVVDGYLLEGETVKDFKI
ncbi:MAG: substrate-binding domain-containing protein, partial [Candidatus Izemoplasmatales bacterium]|nr:substrate-binding domain-containing protein [Candidatus Izemoplasmatales bacterium]